MLDILYHHVHKFYGTSNISVVIRVFGVVELVAGLVVAVAAHVKVG